MDCLLGSASLLLDSYGCKPDRACPTKTQFESNKQSTIQQQQHHCHKVLFRLPRSFKPGLFNRDPRLEPLSWYHYRRRTEFGTQFRPTSPVTLLFPHIKKNRVATGKVQQGKAEQQQQQQQTKEEEEKERECDQWQPLQQPLQQQIPIRR